MKKYFIILILIVLALSACTTTPNSPEESNENPEESNENPEESNENPEESNENPYVWYSIEPVQCGNNAWDKWFDVAHSNDRYVRALTQEEIIVMYFNEELLIPLTLDDIKTENTLGPNDAVCTSCDCGTGDMVSVYVQLYSSPSLKSLGWKLK